MGFEPSGFPPEPYRSANHKAHPRRLDASGGKYKGLVHRNKTDAAGRSLAGGVPGCLVMSARNKLGMSKRTGARRAGCSANEHRTPQYPLRPLRLYAGEGHTHSRVSSKCTWLDSLCLLRGLPISERPQICHVRKTTGEIRRRPERVSIFGGEPDRFPVQQMALSRASLAANCFGGARPCGAFKSC